MGQISPPHFIPMCPWRLEAEIVSDDPIVNVYLVASHVSVLVAVLDLEHFCQASLAVKILSAEYVSDCLVDLRSHYFILFLIMLSSYRCEH